MERETPSSNCNSRPRRYELPSDEERMNGTSNNADFEDEDDDDVAGEYLEVKKKIAFAIAGLFKTRNGKMTKCYFG